VTSSDLNKINRQELADVFGIKLPDETEWKGMKLFEKLKWLHNKKEEILKGGGVKRKKSKRKSSKRKTSKRKTLKRKKSKKRKSSKRKR